MIEGTRSIRSREKRKGAYVSPLARLVVPFALRLIMPLGISDVNDDYSILWCTRDS